MAGQFANGALGTALGLTATPPDRVDELVHLGAEKAQHIEAAKQRKAKADADERQKILDKDSAIIDKTDFSKFAPPLRDAAVQAAKEAQDELRIANDNSRTNVDLDENMGKLFVKLNAKLGELHQSSQNYAFNTTVPQDKTDFWGARQAAASGAENKDAAVVFELVTRRLMENAG